MKNREKYRDEIINFKVYRNYCNDFIIPIILKSLNLKCCNTNCQQCKLIQSIWLEDEYKEPEIDGAMVDNLDNAIRHINILKKLKEKTKENDMFLFYNANLYLKVLEIAITYLTNECAKIIEDYGKSIEEYKSND